MGSGLDQAFLQPQENEEDLKSRSECKHLEIKQFIFGMRELKSLEFLRSALGILTSNIKFTLLMVLSIMPLCACMIYFEIKLQEAIVDVVWKKYFLGPESPDYHPDPIIYPNDTYTFEKLYHDNSDVEVESFLNILHICLFYLFLYPLLDMFSIFITVKLAEKTRAGEKQATFREVLCHNFMSAFVAYLLVHLLSTIIMMCFFWIWYSHSLILRSLSVRLYNFRSMYFYLFYLSAILHSSIFVVLLYKYLHWCAYWNMSIVISVLEERAGITAFGMSEYFGKHFKRTGFQLMVVFFGFCNLPRLPSLYFGVFESRDSGVPAAAAVIGLVCLGNLVKWVVFVLYFNDCKQQTMEKKTDVETGKDKANN